jgi:hypothetical protein
MLNIKVKIENVKVKVEGSAKLTSGISEIVFAISRLDECEVSRVLCNTRSVITSDGY